MDISGTACERHESPSLSIVQETRPVLVDKEETPAVIEQPNTDADVEDVEQTPLPVKPRPAQDGRWRRGGPDKENAVLIQNQQMAEMRQYFKEVCLVGRVVGLGR